MKSLTESILSTSGVGIDAQIKRWLEENEVIADNAYTIKNHIIYPKDDAIVTLFSRYYEELPEYIQFADGPYKLYIGRTDYSDDQKIHAIKSFRGLPKNVSKLTIDFEEKLKIPELNIKTGNLNIYHGGIYNKQNKLNITFDKNWSHLENRYNNFGNIKFDYCTGVNLMDLQNCKFNGFNLIEFGLFAEDEDLPQRSASKLFTDVFDDNNLKQLKPVELSRQQKLKLEKLLKSLGFEDVIRISTTLYKLYNVRGKWLVIKY